MICGLHRIDVDVMALISDHPVKVRNLCATLVQSNHGWRNAAMGFTSRSMEFTKFSDLIKLRATISHPTEYLRSTPNSHGERCI